MIFNSSQEVEYKHIWSFYKFFHIKFLGLLTRPKILIYSATIDWRDGRVVEGAPLLREYGRNPIEGSNPSLSANHRNAPVAQLDRVFGYEPKGRRFESFRAHHTNAVTGYHGRSPVTLNKKISIQITIFFIFHYLLINSSYASPYFVCGPDENGCYDEIYEYCSCIPVNETDYPKPFCLNFNKLTCTPLSETPNCDTSSIYPNQATCLATIFHSIPDTPCTIRTHSFCVENHAYFCDPNGDPNTCHKQNK